MPYGDKVALQKMVDKEIYKALVFFNDRSTAQRKYTDCLKNNEEWTIIYQMQHTLSISSKAELRAAL